MILKPRLNQSLSFGKWREKLVTGNWGTERLVLLRQRIYGGAYAFAGSSRRKGRARDFQSLQSTRDCRDLQGTRPGGHPGPA